MMSDKIQGLIAEMSLAEKAALCTGASMWTTVPVERLGIPEMVVADGPHGIRRVRAVEVMMHDSEPATCFPTASSLAATWNVDLLYEVGETLAAEAIALDVDVILGPGVNMKRTPVCGRNFEYFAEDPFLAGKMATSIVKGIQSKGVGTSVKHFAANNQEFQRFSIDAQIDERTLHEIYLRAFEMVVKEAQPWTIMCSYNRINGEYGSQHYHLLTEILKERWGFEGMVVSDWDAVRDRVAALRVGLDLEMPGPKAKRVQAVIEAVEAGELDESYVDEAVRRILKIVFKGKATAKGGSFDQAKHHELARKVAGEGIVLLKNEGVLPLAEGGKVAVIGRAAREPHFQGGGSSHIKPTEVAVPLAELEKVGGDSEFTFAVGYPEDDSSQPELIAEAALLAEASDVALLFIALPTYKESEGYDRTDLAFTEQQVALIKGVTAVQPRTVVILNNGSAVTMSDWIDEAAAVLEAWMMGQAGGRAIADVLFGHTNPSGKLAETFPLALEDTPAYLSYPGENGVVAYGEGMFIGYRYYDAKKQDVLFSFGHGLSYTTFGYDKARLSAGTFKDKEGVTVSVDVTNEGERWGQEVVQVYVHDRASRLRRPEKELKGFAKVGLAPGETKTVTIELDFRAFAYYDPAYGDWVTEDGMFDVLIGASATDIRARVACTLESTLALPSPLHRESTIREWRMDRRGRVVFEPFYADLKKMGAGFWSGGATDDTEILGTTVDGFVRDMPLLSVLQAQEDSLSQWPEEVVADLLAQVRGMEEEG
ncbi:MAG TPA: glycoside hydrolase family 3 C-terminal domain-containing protein [Anaerolineae bacterium]|nr:glycoside hydrolase family 3 C-terminal domain-containing protein [Anaerolineae bacterium]